MRIAIDFGSTHTVAAVEAADGTIAPLPIPRLSLPGTFLIPSVISFANSGTPLAGYPVERAGLLTAPGTFRWMKRYIALNSPVRVRAGGERVTAQEAAVRFLRQTLIEIEAALAPGTVSELIFTAPTDSFDFYRDWLKRSFEAPNLAVRVLDEAGAAAADAGIRLESGEPFFVLDVGGTTQQALVAAHDSSGTIRVRGKDGRSTGGADIDRWILEELCGRIGIPLQDARLRPQGAALLRGCERLKIALSERETARFEPEDDPGGLTFGGMELTREELETILRRHDFLPNLERMIRDVRNAAAANGVDSSALRKLFAIGGSVRIPAIRAAIRSVFPESSFVETDPTTSVAIGALRAATSGVTPLRDILTHSYAIRYRDGQSGEAKFETIVPSGAVFPSAGVVKTLRLKATRPGQRLFGLSIYERSLTPGATATDPYELLFDENGEVRILNRVQPSEAFESVFLNARAAQFLEADPPASRGEARFSVDFSIDADRFLIVSAIDLRSGRRVLNREPVVRLS